MRDYKNSVDDSGEFQKIAERELSDFLNVQNSAPYSCPNWNISQGRMNRPYEQSASLSDRYRIMSPLEQTQYINEEDMPDVDWSLPKPRNYRLVAAFAFLAAFSISYCCSNTRNVQNEVKEKCEVRSSKNYPNYEPPSFKQGPKK